MSIDSRVFSQSRNDYELNRINIICFQWNGFVAPELIILINLLLIVNNLRTQLVLSNYL